MTKKKTDNKDIKKSSFPLKTVLITVIVTLAVSGTTLWMLGYLGGHTRVDLVDNMDGVDSAVGGPQLFTCGMHPWILAEEPGDCPICGMKLTPKRDAAEETSKSGERIVAYWRAPMDPMEIYDNPGKSKMGMDLVPIYEDEILGGVEIKIDPVTRQNMGLRTAIVEKGVLKHTIRTYGHITYDETRTGFVSPKFNGWFEKLYVDFTGQFIQKGEPLYEIYSPSLVAAQEEYLVAFRNVRRMGGSGNRDMLQSSRRRLEYFDLAESEIKKIESSGRVKKTLTIRSPLTGVVTHKNAVEGGFVKAGTTIYTIADLSRVWVEAHIYEYELPLVKKGMPAHMSLPYMPGSKYTGQVAFIYPYLQQKTRDVVIRLDFENPDLALKPDMYADVHIETGAGKEGIRIPSESVIRSGERNVAFVVREEGKFTPRDVKLGISLDDGWVQILSGVAPGEEVVTSGQFLLDSESKLKEAVQKMMEARAGGPKKPPEAQQESDDDFFGDIEESGSENDDFFDDMK